MLIGTLSGGGGAGRVRGAAALVAAAALLGVARPQGLRSGGAREGEARSPGEARGGAPGDTSPALQSAVRQLADSNAQFALDLYGEFVRDVQMSESVTRPWKSECVTHE